MITTMCVCVFNLRSFISTSNTLAVILFAFPIFVFILFVPQSSRTWHVTLVFALSEPTS